MEAIGASNSPAIETRPRPSAPAPAEAPARPEQNPPAAPGDSVRISSEAASSSQTPAVPTLIQGMQQNFSAGGRGTAEIPTSALERLGNRFADWASPSSTMQRFDDGSSLQTYRDGQTRARPSQLTPEELSARDRSGVLSRLAQQGWRLSEGTDGRIEASRSGGTLAYEITPDGNARLHGPDTFRRNTDTAVGSRGNGNVTQTLSRGFQEDYQDRVRQFQSRARNTPE